MFLIFRPSMVAYIPFKDVEWRDCRSSHPFSIAKLFDIHFCFIMTANIRTSHHQQHLPEQQGQFRQSSHHHYQKYLQLAWDSSQESQNSLLKF